MSGEILNEFNEQIAELKNKIYDSLIRNNPKDEPGSLMMLHNYESLLKKIFLYWKTLYNVGSSVGYSIRMPTEGLQKLFHEKTAWYIQNIVKNPDTDVRYKGIFIVEQNCEKDPHSLKNEAPSKN